MNAIKEFRIKNGIKQKELAKELGVSQGHLSMIENDIVQISNKVSTAFQDFAWSHFVDSFGVKDEVKVNIIDVPEVEVVEETPPHSEHYHQGSIDVWEFADKFFNKEKVIGFHQINAIKYIARYGLKDGFNQKDLDKAIAEINKLKEITKGE